MNATVGGLKAATSVYKTSVLNHPWFSQMKTEDFKTSDGAASDFPDGLKVGVFNEVCPMGIDPQQVPFTQAGMYLIIFSKLIDS